jgi:hypothetical protein
MNKRGLVPSTPAAVLILFLAFALASALAASATCILGRACKPSWVASDLIDANMQYAFLMFPNEILYVLSSRQLPFFLQFVILLSAYAILFFVIWKMKSLWLPSSAKSITASIGYVITSVIVSYICFYIYLSPSFH